MIQGFAGPGSRFIAPDLFELLLQNHHGVDHFVQGQELFELLSVFFSTNVATVFQQQIFGALEDGFILSRGFAVFAVTDLVDDPAESGDDMKLIEDDLRLRQFFLTALM